MSDLRNIIRQLAQPDGETVALVCTVDEVDKNARTIDCTPINEGAPLLGVNLQANQEADYGFCLFPEKGSFVVVGFVADGAAGVVLLTEKIESAEIVIDDTSAVMDGDGLRIKTEKMSADFNRDNIIFNGGDLNGLVVIQKLTDKLNELKDTVNDLITKYNTHVHVCAAPGSPCKPIDVPAQTAKAFNKSDYENTKIKQ